MVSPSCWRPSSLIVVALTYATTWLAPAAAVEARSAVASRPRVHLYVGEIQADTLEATPAEISQATERALEDDHWIISRDSNDSRVVTEWKRLRHPLARLFGKIEARSLVAIQPLDDRLTIVRFRGDLASRDDIEHNPALVVAKQVYRGAVRDFYRDLDVWISRARGEKGSALPTMTPRVP